MIQFQEYLQSDYPGFASFIDTIIKPIFGDNFKAVTNIDDMIDCLNEDPEELEFYDEIAKSTDESLKSLAEESGLERVLKLGTIQVQGDTRPIYVYDITVSKRRQLSRNRKGIQQLIARTLNNQSGAFMLFHYGDADWEWRFSYKFVGKDREDTTNSKRFTYLLGRDQVCKTAAMRFTNLLNKKGKIAFDDITEAFSVEKISKEFFEKYKVRYGRFVAYVIGKEYVDKGEGKGEWRDKEGLEPSELFYGLKQDEKVVRDYVKKLLGRIVFLHFLQKKGWLGATDEDWTNGPQDFMLRLFDKATSEQKDNFLDEILEPLFSCLDTPLDKRNEMFDTQIEGLRSVRVPFLGGLFERDEQDKADSIFPAELFADLFQFLSEYNFTIDENDPNDAQVGVDPEMLGRIFENLLEDNKDKGAFYTPKEIVQYMCRESLIAYLQTDVTDEATRDALRQFVTTHDVSVLGGKESALAQNVSQCLKDVKICDPAIGSGAFPMGLLNELFLCRGVIEDFANAAAIKRHIIQQNIYGVDIEKGAVEIARLRFWLSLITDADTPEVLPNMDFKIMQGNSLLEQYKGFDLSHIMDTKQEVHAGHQYQMFEDQIDVIRAEVKDTIKRYYGEQNHDLRRSMRESIQQKIQRQIEVQGNNVDITDIKDISANDQFFLWHTWFSEVFEEGGFDIVIGNPPYIQLQANEGLLSNLYHNKGFETFNGSGDIFSLFYEEGWRIIKEKGHLCYITSNKWMRNASGEETRAFFASNTNPKLIFDFAGIQLFENATVETNIILFARDTNALQTIAVTTDETSKEVLDNLYDFAFTHSSVMSFDNSEDWVILSRAEVAIQNKISKIAVPLKNWSIEINFGLKTGYNTAFVIDSKQRQSIIENCISETERMQTEKIIVPVLRGRDTKRYIFNWDNLWIINTHNGLRRELEPIDIESLPSIKAHLDNYWNKISTRSDKGITPYNLRNCAYLKEFQKPKIIWGEISDKSKFCYDEEGRFYCEATTFFMTGDISTFLLCYLNSKLSEYLFSKIATRTGMGTTRWKKYKIEKLFVPHVSKELENQVDSLYRTYMKSNDDKYLHEIDLLVYDLYGLTPEEIAIVEGTKAE